MSSERTVPCPVCRQPAVLGSRNPYRPFCSGRCRDLDLGAWASEGYRVANQAPAEDERPDDERPPRH